MTKKANIAVFDFDGTLTKKDTFIEFIKFSFGRPQLYLGLIYFSPLIVLMKFKIISNEYVKEKIFSYFFKGLKFDFFESLCFQFKDQINSFIDEIYLEKLKFHQNNGFRCIIISASIENWIIPWAKEQNIDLVIGTKIESLNDVISGDFQTRNCFGQEKVNRFLEIYPNRTEYLLYAYGDSVGDKELLSFADKAELKKS